MRNAVRVVLLILLAAVAWRGINYVSGLEPGPDSSIFMSMASHANAGRVLYKEVWENKPPMIFALDAVALAMGDHSVNSVRFMERLFAIAGVAALFATVFLGFGRFWLAYLAGVLFLFNFFLPDVFEQGNITEEYGTIFMIAGMAATAASLRFRGRRSLIFCGLAGLSFSAAVLSKEPFLLIVPPWFIAAAWPHAGDWKDVTRRAAAFLCGAAVPGLVFVTYLLSHGAWSDWVDVISYGFAYAKYAGPPRGTEGFLPHLFRMANTRLLHFSDLCRVAALLGLASLLSGSFVRQMRGLPVVVAASAVLSLMAASLGGRYYGHYFLQFVPSYVLLGASGVAFIAHLVTVPRHRVLGALAGAASLAALAMDFRELRDFGARLAAPAQRWKDSWLSESVRINTSPEDMIWAPWKPLIYSESGRLSPTKWHFVFDHVFLDTRESSAAEKLGMLRNDLQRRPPRIIIVNDYPGAQVYQFLDRSGLTSWIAANYSTVIGSRADSVQVLVLHGPPPSRH